MDVQPAYSDEANKFLARAPALLINGEWRKSDGDAIVEVVDPSRGEVVGAVADASASDIDRAVRSASAAFEDGRWSRMAPARREAHLRRLADLIEASAPILAELEAIDSGKTLTSAERVDLPLACAALRYSAGWCGRIEGGHHEAWGVSSGRHHSYVRREPIGVVAAIVPWNFPLAMAISKLAPALAAGCTVVLKPAEQTSLTALLLADLVTKADVPAGVVNVVTGTGQGAGAALVRHPLVAKVAFTGSTEVGKAILRSSADQIKRVTLELGGKSPAILLPDVDAAAAGAAAAGSAFFNAGQVCTAGTRVYAHRSQFDVAVEQAVTTAGAIRMGPALSRKSQMGPLVSVTQRDRVLRYVEGARASGAGVLCGGEPVGETSFHVSPAVTVDVTSDMPIAREEVFGPVISIYRYDDLDEVVGLANDSDYGLAASIWTNDLSAMHRLASRLKAGVVWGNCHGGLDLSMPFGGYGRSGLGREGGSEGIHAYLETKSVMIQL